MFLPQGVGDLDRPLEQAHLGESFPEKFECVPVEEVTVRMQLIVGSPQVIDIFDFSFHDNRSFKKVCVYIKSSHSRIDVGNGCLNHIKEYVR